MTKKDYIYNGVYLTILVLYYLFNVEVFDYSFKEAEISPPSDDITYLVCTQTKQSNGVPLFVMLDTNLEDVYLKYGKDFLEVWDIIEDKYSNVSFKDNKVVFNYEFRAKEKDLEESKVTYMQVWKVMIDRYLLTLNLLGTRYTITEVDSELSLSSGEYYEDRLDCNKMDKRL